ncbi:DNA excision repair protein Rad2 [Talaromyces proteolyticus]|uniref:DNA excision repair protein Rad2 n=1 Tax=Talaromyces proteolyticus TaxID=1131652 RepID=A0AAD4KZW6_9EURO|nr:DNA excision repair protein Rad2 [Talaromyces proteolyticus]KAH8700920.1 DNA excision repair protein Rad2 [Talaromyces proteolyticus]
MGVTGLWTVVQPCARPIKLETLNRKRLAVDASIWIYQFLKAVRDKEGNALRNAHVVGFFRRICKLLFFGIKPVFVFDGGAPVLKRQTIAARRKRREGRREDAVRTAGKLLAIQIQRQAEEEETRRRHGNIEVTEQGEISAEARYVDETFMTPKERQKNRKFRKKDTYHLPDLDVSLDHMGGADDPRIMSQEELEEYARQFHNGEDINLYDFSKIDFDSPFFMSLPASDRYNILNAARIRSRLRMGYSKEQLDSMFPDRMAFSKFQIERVKERNDLTQRLMNINGMNGEEAIDFNSGQRIAGERGKEYVLVKNPDVEGGWALGVVGNKEGTVADRPIDVDQYGQPDILPVQDDEDDDNAFEDIPIEGLNRLPKLPILQKGIFDEAIQRHKAETLDRRKAVYTARREEAGISNSTVDDEDNDALFVPVERSPASGDMAGLFGDDEDEDLSRAIAMSLERAPEAESTQPVNTDNLAKHAPPTFDSMSVSESEDGDEMDFTAALAQAKKAQPEPRSKAKAPEVRPEYKFNGPLPFETLKINNRAKEELPRTAPPEADAGGFERQDESIQSRKKKKAEALPPWFIKNDGVKADFIEDRNEEEPVKRQYDDTLFHQEILSRNKSPEVIDVDEIPESKEIIDLDAEEQEASETESVEQIMEQPTLMDDITENIRMKPSTPSTVAETQTVFRDQEGAGEEKEISDWEPTDDEQESTLARATSATAHVNTDLVKSISPSPEFEDVELAAAVPVQNTAAFAETSAAILDEQDAAMVDNEVPYSDPEDEDLMVQLAAEAEEHARFASTLNNKTQAENARDFEQELKQLRNQQKKDRRDADEVSQIMVSECQQLLRLFGLPYITAPMEAEAQCAQLVSLGLVDGIVTDDSDTFLFGGTRIYKNMFNQSKYVECFLANDLEKEYALDRPKLIRFAHLLGSDYTEGIAGVGPVTALEIITEFQDLEKFRDWWMQVQLGVEITDDPHHNFRKKFKKMATKLFLPPSFPDTHIDEAYLNPEVDNDASEFQWGVPDLNGLRSYLMATIGWSQERTDEVLLPVIRDMNKREQEGTQANITRFVGGGLGAGAFAPRVRAEGKSRMDKALSRLAEQAKQKEQANQATQAKQAKESRKRRRGD